MPTSGIFVDDNVVITIDATQFDEITSWSFDRSIEQIETTSFDSAGDKTYKPGDRDATISIEALWKADSSHGLKETLDDIEARTVNTILITSEVSGDDTISASGNVSSVSLSASKNSPATVSITFQVTGGITLGTVA